MRFTCYLLAICFLFSIVTLNHAHAQGHGTYCDQADSTASTVKCLKKHLETAQKRLNLVYKKLEKDMTSEQMNELKDLQKTWLTYRDNECMWETQRSEVLSMKQVNELSCMARVTDDRADLLTVTLSGVHNDSGLREFGSFPRWMNVVAKDIKDAYWDYGTRQSMDLNCDDEEEFVMIGNKTNKIKTNDKGEEATRAIYNKEIVLAIVENPPIGRPKLTKFSFPVNEANDDNRNICHDNVSIKLIEQESKEPAKEAETTCSKTLKISAPKCTDKTISWNGKEFKLDILPSDDKNATENKK